MGDRAIFYVKEAKCAVFIHTGGKDAVESLKAAIPKMRWDDPDASTARLIGVLAAKAGPEPHDLIIVEKPTAGQAAEFYTGYSKGDAGVLIYDCNNGELCCYAGYLSDQSPNPIQLDKPPGGINVPTPTPAPGDEAPPAGDAPPADPPV